MKILDLNGYLIEITDLTAALKQAEEFTSYRHVNRQFSQLDSKLNAYWKDMLNKLLALQDNSQEIQHDGDERKQGIFCRTVDLNIRRVKEARKLFR